MYRTVDDEEGIKLERKFQNYLQKDDDSYFVSNYLLADGRDFCPVLADKELAENIDGERINPADYTVLKRRATVGELIERKGISVEMYSKILESNGTEVPDVKESKILDSSERYLNTEPLEEGKQKVRKPNKLREDWRSRRGGKYEATEWSITGENWPAFLDILEEEDVESYEELEEIEVCYNELVFIS